MTSHVARLYTSAIALVVFFLVWVVIAAHPWGAASSTFQLRQLSVREAQLRQQAQLVKLVVSQRWATYRAELKARKSQIGASSGATTVRVVNLPPLTITRSS
jgi:hypothetical protein